MSVQPVIFEDQTLAGFRPHAWSLPVAELRCGVLNPRERVAHLAELPPVLLVRSILAGLASAAGHTTTVTVAPDQTLLFLSGRLGARWDILEDALTAARQGTAVAWRDDAGWLAFTATEADAGEVLDSWAAWEASAATCWSRSDVSLPTWDPPGLGPGTPKLGAWQRIWDLVPATAAAMDADLARLDGRLPERRIWGVVPDGGVPWTEAVDLHSLRDVPVPGVTANQPEHIWLGDGCDLAAGVAIDARGGPVILGRDVRILPHSYLEGPLYIGSGSLIKAGACIYGETSLGAACKVAGEIGESTFLDLANKQHEGFIGHAYVGSWTNLGALTTCSDLKNTYGSIRVDLGSGAEDSGQQFVGLLMGEHGKTAIGTLFNTGTSVGFCSNVFGNGFPRKCLPNFTWGDGQGRDRQDVERALQVARTVMARRGCLLTPDHERVFRALSG